MGFVPELDARRKAATRNRILKTGFEVFAEKTIDATSIQQIADAAGIGIATVFRHFSSKSELVAAVSTWAWSQYTGKAISGLDLEKQTAAEVFESYLEAFIDLYRNHKDLLRYNQFFNIYVMREGISPTQMSPFLNIIDGMAARFHAMYQKAMADGTLRTDIPEREMLSKTLHLMLAAVTRYAVGLVYDSGIDPEEELLFLKKMLLREYTVNPQAAA